MLAVQMDELETLRCQYCPARAVFFSRAANTMSCDAPSCRARQQEAPARMLRQPLDLGELVRTNEQFRRVVHTEEMQVVVMSVPVGGAIGDCSNTVPEVHHGVAQFILLQQGEARVTRYYGSPTCMSLEPCPDIAHVSLLGGADGKDALMIEPGVRHYIENTGEIPLKLLTIYSRPQH